MSKERYKNIQNITDKPESLPYPNNIGSIAFKPDNVSAYLEPHSKEANNYFIERLKELEEEYSKLQQQYDDNMLVYSAEVRFKPIVGHTYYLYERDGKKVLSLLSKEQLGKEGYLGAFKLDTFSKWKRIDEG